jgi:hypothetical protein
MGDGVHAKQMRGPAQCFWLTLALLGWPGVGTSALAQYSPRCVLNGVQVFCAITSYGRPGGPWQKTTIVLDDERRIDLHVDRSTCQEEKGDTSCSARITMRDSMGSGSAMGRYLMHRSEGGVSHRYWAGGIDLTYFFMD